MNNSLLTTDDIDQLLDEMAEKDKEDPRYKKSLLREKRREKALKDSRAAEVVAQKFLEENPDINVGYLIEHLQKQILSTTQCCSKLGISPNAFLRLRRKYKLEPIYSLKNDPSSLRKSNKVFHSKKISPLAIKNFYNPKQIKSIPQADISAVQLRAARAFKFPDGENVGWKWTNRGYHMNGKLKARTENLTKLKIKYAYFDKDDKYAIDFDGYRGKYLTRQEVDKLNFKIKKLKAFL